MYDQPTPAPTPEITPEYAKKRSRAALILGCVALFCTLSGFAGQIVFAIASRGFGMFFLFVIAHPVFLILSPFGIAAGIVGIILGKRGMRLSRAAGVPVTHARVGFILSIIGLAICAYHLLVGVAFWFDVIWDAIFGPLDKWLETVD